MESGTKLEKEVQLLAKYPSLLSGYIDRPTVILDEGGTIAVWYLPGAVSRTMQVCTTIASEPIGWSMLLGHHCTGYTSAV